MEATPIETGTVDGAELQTAPVVHEGNGHAATSPAARTLGAALDRHAFLTNAKKSRPLRRVDLPWMGDGVHVFIRGLSSNGRDTFDVRAYTVRPDKTVITHTKGLRALLVCLCTCDADGRLLFTEDDLPALEELDARTSDAIYTEAASASGLTQQDVEDLVKN